MFLFEGLNNLSSKYSFYLLYLYTINYITWDAWRRIWSGLVCG